MKQHTSHSSGYTLIELLVVIALIAAIAAMTFTLNTNDARDLARLEVGARDVTSGMRYVQGLGLSGKPWPPDSTDPAHYDRGYGVYLTKIVTHKDRMPIYHGRGDTLPNDGVWTRVEEVYHSSVEHDELRYPAGVEVTEIEPTDASGTPLGTTDNWVSVLWRRGAGTVIHTTSDSYAAGVRITFNSSAGDRYVYVFQNGLIYHDES